MGVIFSKVLCFDCDMLYYDYYNKMNLKHIVYYIDPIPIYIFYWNYKNLYAIDWCIGSLLESGYLTIVYN